MEHLFLMFLDHTQRRSTVGRTPLDATSSVTFEVKFSKAAFVILLTPSKNSILTLRLLMSYIYMEHLFLMFLDHTQRRSTVGRTPLDE